MPSWGSCWVGLVCWLMLLSDRTCRADDAWTAFHNGGGTSVGAVGLPLTWTPERGVAWRVELPGYGQSAPIVYGGRVYLTAVEGAEKERCHVLCLDATTGEERWRREFAASVPQRYAYTVTRAAPTPLVDAAGLYVLFESGDLHALTLDGEPRWHCALFDGAARAFQNRHGYGASPAQTADNVIVLVDHQGPSYVAAIDKRTGQQRWKTERTPRGSWTSPQVLTLPDGQQQVVISSNGSVDGYEAGTGRLLWSQAEIRGNTIPSASIDGDRVFVGAGAGEAGSNCCLRISPDGHELLWTSRSATCEFSSPLVHRDCVYYVSKAGVLYCLDAATGEQHYAERIGGACWAQPIAAGDRLYFFTKSGPALVVAAGSRFEQLAVNRLWDEADPPLPAASPAGDASVEPPPSDEYLDPLVYGVAAVDGAFYVRLGTRVYCITGD